MSKQRFVIMNQIKHLIVLLFMVGCTSSVTDYTGHQVVRVHPRNQQQLGALSKLEEDQSTSKLRIWRAPREVHEPVDIHVPADVLSLREALQGYLGEHDFTYDVLVHDLQDAITAHTRSNVGSNELVFKNFDFGQYNKLQLIHKLMDDLAEQYKDMAATFTIGKSFEGRNIKGLKISKTGRGGAKKAILIDGGIHCREWITSATLSYMMYQLLSQYGKDQDITHIVDNLDWYFLPVFNVDGYNYTWTQDRLWRKNRAPVHGSNCIGTDLNRNWNLGFAKAGASDDPCSETYHGPAPFSEPESKAMSDFMSSLGHSLVSYVNVHSYSQFWMSPWGVSNQVPSQFAVQDQGSALAVEALEKVYGTKYKHGSIARTIYKASGNSIDWAYGKAGIEFSYAIELRDTGEHGFLLPAKQILPTGRETLEGFKALAKYIIQQQQN